MKSISCVQKVDSDNKTAKYLTPFAEQKSQKIHDRRNDYHVICYSKTDWLVMHKNGRKSLRPNNEQSNVPYDNCFSIPAFTNVYKVSLCIKKNRMKCSCCTVIRIGMPCQHIYAVLPVRVPDMFHVRWYTLYNSLILEISDNMKKALDMMKSEHFSNFDSIYVGSVMSTLEVWNNDIHLSMNAEIANEMVYAHVNHLHEAIVLKSTNVVDIPDGISIVDDHREFILLYCHITAQAYDASETTNSSDICEAISDDSNPSHIVSKKKERSRLSTIEDDKVRYYHLMNKAQSLAKIGEGRPDLYDELLNKLDNLNLEFTKRAIKSNKKLQLQHDTQANSTIVSSNASIGCTPARGRYKGSDES